MEKFWQDINVFTKNALPQSALPFPRNLQTEKENIISLYQYINEKYSIRITRVEDRISASAATFDEAVALNCEPQSALIVVRRVCYMSGSPFEVDYVKIIASKYEYKNYFDTERS